MYLFIIFYNICYSHLIIIFIHRLLFLFFQHEPPDTSRPRQRNCDTTTQHWPSLPVRYSSRFTSHRRWPESRVSVATFATASRAEECRAWLSWAAGSQLQQGPQAIELPTAFGHTLSDPYRCKTCWNREQRFARAQLVGGDFSQPPLLSSVPTTPLASMRSFGPNSVLLHQWVVPKWEPPWMEHVFPL